MNFVHKNELHFSGFLSRQQSFMKKYDWFLYIVLRSILAVRVREKSPAKY
jgi:hypothetical protein